MADQKFDVPDALTPGGMYGYSLEEWNKLSRDEKISAQAKWGVKEYGWDPSRAYEAAAGAEGKLTIGRAIAESPEYGGLARAYGKALPVTPWWAKEKEGPTPGLMQISQEAIPVPGEAGAPPTQPPLAFRGGQQPPQLTLGSAFGRPMPRMPMSASIRPITEAQETIKAFPGQIESLTAESMEKLKKVQEARRGAVQAEAEITADTQERQYKIQRAGMEAFEDITREQKQRVDVAHASVETTMNKYRQAVDRFASMKVDPGRRFRGQRTSAAIAMALGAFGSAMTGGPNQAMQIIQSEIDRDIRAQEGAIDRAGKQAGLLNNEMTLARQLFQDAESQKLAAEAAHWKDVRNRVKLVGEESKNLLTLANSEKLLAEIDAKGLGLEQQLKEKQLSYQMEAGKMELTGAQVEFGAKQQKIASQQRAAALQAKAQADQAKAVMGSMAPPGLALVDPNFKPTKTMTTEAQKITASFRPLKKTLQSLLAWRLKYGGKLTGNAYYEGATILERAKKAMAKHDDAGVAISDNEIKMFGLPEDITGYEVFDKSVTKINTLLRLETEKTLEMMYPWGYTLRPEQTKGRMQERAPLAPR